MFLFQEAKPHLIHCVRITALLIYYCLGCFYISVMIQCIKKTVHSDFFLEIANTTRFVQVSFEAFELIGFLKPV